MKTSRNFFGPLLLGLCVLFHPAPAAASSVSAGAVKAKVPLAMNLASPGDSSPGYPFKNLMWGARSWLTKNVSDGGPFNTEMASKFPLDPQGYPLEVPFLPEGASEPQKIFTIIPNTVEPGEYVVLYDGEGTIRAAMSSTVIDSKPGRVVLRLRNERGVRGYTSGAVYEGIEITASKRGNHVRNIRILSLADEKADLKANPFREDFLAYAKQWHSLRFMVWQVTNDSLEKEWGERKRPDFYTMIGTSGDATRPRPDRDYRQLFSGGVALEIIIQLANMTMTDPWVCVPHRATPEYVTEMARLFKATLDPRLKVYMEYSNEVWNWQFRQAGWMLQSKLAGDMVTARGGNAWKNGEVPAEFPYDDGAVAKEGGEGHPERMGALNRHVFELIERVFTGEDRKRLVRVVGVQHGWVDTGRRTALWVMENGGADALSPGGYFGPNKRIYERWEAAGASLTADQVIADMHEALETQTTPDTRALAAVARGHGLRYIVYEGGQHIQPRDQKETNYMPALRAAQFHPGMYDVYMKNFALHQEVGCDLFAVFASIGEQGKRWGSWGHQEYYGQSRAEIPKFGALLDANMPRSK